MGCGEGAPFGGSAGCAAAGDGEGAPPGARGLLCGRSEPKTGLGPKVGASLALLDAVFNFAAKRTGQPENHSLTSPLRFTAGRTPQAPPPHRHPLDNSSAFDYTNRALAG